MNSSFQVLSHIVASFFMSGPTWPPQDTNIVSPLIPHSPFGVTLTWTLFKDGLGRFTAVPYSISLFGD